MTVPIPAIVAATVPTLVFDYHWTRGFASAMRAQLAAVEASVSVSSQVAALLAEGAWVEVDTPLLR